jgi:PAS domain S-box-containing protein
MTGKRLEEPISLQKLIDNIPAGVMLIDAETHVIEQVNRETAILFGARPEDIVGHVCHNFICQTEKGACPVTDKNETISSAERVFCRADGTSCAVIKSVKKIMVDGREKLLECLIDISARKKAEEENRRLGQNLRQSDKMIALGTLISGITHEINNPNCAILVTAPLVCDIMEQLFPRLDSLREESGQFMVGGMTYDQVREKLPRLLKGMEESGRRIDAVITRLKKFIRANAARNVPQLLDLNQVVRESFDLIQSRVRKRTENFDLILSKEPILIMGDFADLGQIVINLLFNAIEALENKNQAVSIKCQVDLTNLAAVLEIRDEGCGISESDLSQVLDPFFTTKRDSGAVGLGLTVAAGIIQEHRGKLELESTPGMGTVARVTFPLGEA